MSPALPSTDLAPGTLLGSMPLPSAAVAPLLSVPLPSRPLGVPALPSVALLSADVAGVPLGSAALPSGPLALRASGALPVTALALLPSMPLPSPALGAPLLPSTALLGSDA